MGGHNYPVTPPLYPPLNFQTVNPTEPKFYFLTSHSPTCTENKKPKNLENF